ncbi:MAG: hypothetical protein H7339_18415 [Arcicella sp.]|nr:hypothetical protein [Arcicella sp.]
MKKSFITFTVLFISTLTFSQNLTQKVFDGTLNKKIPVIITLTFDNKVVFGNVVYKKKGIPINLIGRIDSDNTMFFNELLKDGHATGAYSVTLKDGIMKGSWYEVGKINGKKLSVSLEKVSETTVPKNSIPDVTGTYSYFYGNDGGSGSLDVQQIGKNKVAIAFNCVRGTPSYNMATIDKSIIELSGNQAVYGSTEYGKCKFRITFLQNGVNVEYVPDSNECGFGNEATVSGNYIKINSLKPKFLNNN